MNQPFPNNSSNHQFSADASAIKYLATTSVMVFKGRNHTLKNHPDKTYPMITVEKILQLIKNPQNTDKEMALATIGSSYNRHDARTHSTQEQFGNYYLLRFDIDEGNLPIDEIKNAYKMSLQDAIFFIYSTSSASPSSFSINA
jgi:hypothetical protein